MSFSKQLIALVLTTKQKNTIKKGRNKLVLKPTNCHRK